jgi:hypothetical protein
MALAPGCVDHAGDHAGDCLFQPVHHISDNGSRDGQPGIGCVQWRERSGKNKKQNKDNFFPKKLFVFESFIRE